MEQHSGVGLPSEVDIFLCLGGETVTSIITEKPAPLPRKGCSLQLLGEAEKG